jgi:pimeloyl-ACP methyl ester carboxylesterase
MSETYAATSRIADLDGPTHYLDFGGPAGAPLILAVHGLGGAAWNWLAVAPLLASDCRMLAIDLAGHGLSPAAGRSTSVRANRHLLGRFIREVVQGPVVLMGNSMGGLISLLQTAATPDLIEGLALVDPALPRPLLSAVDPRVAMQFAVVALPGLGEAAIARRRRSQSIRDQVYDTLKMCTVDINRVPREVIDEGIHSIESRKPGEFGASDILVAGRSLLRIMSRPAVLRRRFRSITTPVLLIHGDRDRLVSIKVARAISREFPDWRFEIATDIGHVPMLEAAPWTADVVISWLTREVKLLPA